MGQQIAEFSADPERLRIFMKRLLTDVHALEQMLAEGRIESDKRRIGAEQELVLIDATGRPAPIAMEILEGIKDPRFCTELARFNLEFNLEPLAFGGDCLRRLEADMHETLRVAQTAAAQHGASVVLTGILPTIRKSDLDLENMTPLPRYYGLDKALRQLRGGAYEFRLTGTDELIMRHDSVMLEACNTSCQFHFQVGAEEFAHLYNVAQAVAGPVMAAATNSPLLFGRRLWRETRIALFQQAVDTRQPGHQLEERSARVRFGKCWVDDSVLEIFREDISRFRVVLAEEIDEDPFEVMARGGAASLKALQLHNGTVYRWNRACYGISEGKPHLRIENRIFPSGPTVVDEVANAAFWFGLISGTAGVYEDITRHIEFDTARNNFLIAARLGLDAHLSWVGQEPVAAAELITRELLPLAREGLRSSGIDEQDVTRYLDIIEERVTSRRTGSQWMLDSMAALADRGNLAEQLSSITLAMKLHQQSGKPVHEWSGGLPEVTTWPESYRCVDHFMTTDVFTVCEDEVIDLVASLMDWQHIRHVPVEDAQHRLVGLISYRQLLRVLAHDLPHGEHDPVPASRIMQRDPIVVQPETPTLEAIAIMREKEIPCLPVVKDDRLVGIITERDFLRIAAELLESQLRNAT